MVGFLVKVSRRTRYELCKKSKNCKKLWLRNKILCKGSRNRKILLWAHTKSETTGWICSVRTETACWHPFMAYFTDFVLSSLTASSKKTVKVSSVNAKHENITCDAIYDQPPNCWTDSLCVCVCVCHSCRLCTLKYCVDMVTSDIAAKNLLLVGHRTYSTGLVRGCTETNNTDRILTKDESDSVRRREGSSCREDAETAKKNQLQSTNSVTTAQKFTFVVLRIYMRFGDLIWSSKHILYFLNLLYRY